MTYHPIVAVNDEHKARDVLSVLSLAGVYGVYRSQITHWSVCVRIADVRKADSALSIAVESGDLTL